jgi:outer membrane protein OmpA-like peptidoglycan-associated protein
VSEEPVSSLSSSFTDLMTSLAVIFILLLVAATNSQVQKLKKESEKKNHATQDARGNLEKQLKDSLGSIVGMSIYADPRDPLAVIVILPKTLNFLKGKSDILAPGQDFLSNFVPRFADVVCALPDEVNSMVVEGHTDPDGPDLFNVRLSQGRSMAVAKMSLEILSPDVRNYGCFLHLLSASGRGKNDLVPTETGGVDKDASRRVLFRVRVPSSEQREMQEKLRTSAGTGTSVDSEHEH